MKVAIKLLIVILTVLFWSCLRMAMREADRREGVTRARMDKREDHLSFRTAGERRVVFLSRKGVHFRRKHQVSLREYEEIRLACGLGCALAGMLLAGRLPAVACLGITILLLIVGTFLPCLYDRLEDHEDNKKILRDMHRVYDTLRVYLAVDCFITDALEECYRRVANKRLKTAIYELKEGLRSQSEQLSVIETFRLKFDNPHIDQLANLLSQYYRSGNVEGLMTDLSEQMAAIDHAINLRLKERLGLKALLQEVLVLMGMLGGIAVALLASISDLMGDLF